MRNLIHVDRVEVDIVMSRAVLMPHMLNTKPSNINALMLLVSELLLAY